MKLSVITPCGTDDLQRITDLQQTLRQQKGVDFEWIVACQRFTNLPQAILNGAKVVSDHQGTLGAALQQAIRAAQGDELVFVAADDYLLPHALQHLLAAMRTSSAEGFDLNPYPTYEPMQLFVRSVRLSRNSRALPDYGGLQRQTVKNKLRDGTLRRSRLLEIVRTEPRYFRGFDNRLALIGKAVPRRVAQKLVDVIDVSNPLDPAVDFALHLSQVVGKYQPLEDFEYVRVHHNDPINDPSLSQQPRGDHWSWWLRAAVKAARDRNVRPRLKISFERYTLKYIMSYLYDDLLQRTALVPKDHSVLLKQLATYLDLLPGAAASPVRHLDRRVFRAVRRHRFARAQHLMAKVRDFRALRQIVLNRGRGITKWMYFKHYLKHPVNPRVILFESFLGRNYSDNPKYIYRYIQRHYPGRYRCVWIADQDHFAQISRDLSHQSNTVVVRRFGFRYMFYLATAKYVVFNMRQPKWFVKRPGVRLIETWHGTPLKHLVFDMANVASASLHYKQVFYHQSRQWDHLVTDNPYSYRVFHHAFMYPQSRMLKSGYPRNDVLSSPHRDVIARRVKKRLGIPPDKKVIFYAPTWRDNQFIGHGHYRFTLHLNIDLLRRYLSRDYVLVLRTHYFITNRLNLSRYGNFVYDASNYDDISQLYLIADVLITDYSSVFFDYANLKRPILFYVYDYDTYAGVLRGFYLDMKKDLPGPLIKTSWGLLNAIQHLDRIKKRYRNRYRKFNQRFNVWDDGHAAARVTKALLGGTKALAQRKVEY